MTRPTARTGIILLVEDNPDDSDLTLIALQENRIANEVVVVRDGEAALNYLFGTGEHSARDASVLPQLCLLDIQMLKINGIDVLRRVREDERTRMMPVVVLTSSDEEQDLLETYEIGVNSYIRKPVDFTKFLEAVRQLGMYWLMLNQTP